MHILIAGTGYVGLVTGACFAEMGHHVMCLDIDEAKVTSLKQGILPFFEPGLSEMVLRNIHAERLSFTSSYEEGCRHASICFIATPTPPLPDGSSDISYVLASSSSIAEHMTKPFTLVIKSTVPVGTSHRIKEELKRKKIELSFDIISNPEFLKEGSAVADCMKPDRIVIGAESPEAIHLMKELYAPFTHNHDRLLVMGVRSAEMTKYASNAMLAARISFMNELSLLCEPLGADIGEVRIGMGADTRIGYHFLYAGIGYGGSCFPKDLAALRAMAQSVNKPTPLLDAIDTVNHRQKKAFSEKIERYFEGNLCGKTIAIWGLSFKPNTDDMRQAPALCLIRRLIEKGATLRLYDPASMDTAKKHVDPHPLITWCPDEYEAAKGSHAIALVTEWKQFRFVDFNKIIPNMEGKGFFDGRNQYKHQEMRAQGFDYFGIGIPS